MLNAIILAALSIVPAYTNNNRFTGMVMTNMQAWASSVETAIENPSTDTNAVQGIIQKNIDTNLLCTVAAAQGIITPVSNDVVRKRGLLDLNVYTNVLNTAPFDSRCVGTDYITWSIVQGVGYVFILHYDCGSRYGESECYLSEGVEIRNPYTNERRVRINYVNSGEGEPELVELLRPYQDLGGTDLYFDKIQETGVLLATENDLPSTNGFVTAGVTNGLASAASVSTLNQGYSRLYSFSTGATNANFTATNYPPTAAAAAAKVHWEPEEGMDFSTVPASLQLNERRDGDWRTVMDTRDWTVWYYRFKERQLTNEIARLKAENAVISNRLETAKAWGNYTANGVDNPLTDTTVVDRPNMWIMADYEWQKCVSGTNSCWVIRAKNAAISGGANTNGFLEICDAFGRPYMRVNKSEETFADAVFSDIHFDDEEGAWYVVFGNQAKPTKGGANCNIVGASSGGGRCILYDEDLPECPATITWPETADSHAGHWIMKAVPKPVNGVVPTMMFFGAEIKVAGKDYVEYIKEASFGAGIRVGNNVYEAVESGNTLIWQKKVD